MIGVILYIGVILLSVAAAVFETDFLLWAVVLAASGLVLFSVNLFHKYWSNKILRFFFSRPYGQGLWLHPLLLILASAALPLAEPDGSPFDSFVGALVRMLMPFIPVYGWEAGQPESNEGIVIASLATIAFLVNGIFNIGTVIPMAIQYSKRRLRMKYEGHFVIWGGEPHIPEIVAQLTSSALGEEKMTIVVLCDESFVDELKNLLDEYRSPTREIEVIPGSAQVKKNLRDINIARARSVLLMPPEHESQPELSLLSAASVVREIVNKEAEQTGYRPFIVAKTSSPILVEPLRKFADRVLCPPQLEYLLLAETSINPMVLDVYYNLLTISEETNEFYFLPVPESFVGKDFRALQRAIAQISEEISTPVITVGVVRNGTVKLNPAKSTLLDEGDQIILMAYRFSDCQKVWGKIKSTP